MYTFGNTMRFFILFVIDVCPWQLYVADELGILEVVDSAMQAYSL
jgi:hypothetical protein